MESDDELKPIDNEPVIDQTSEEFLNLWDKIRASKPGSDLERHQAALDSIDVGKGGGGAVPYTPPYKDSEDGSAMSSPEPKDIKPELTKPGTLPEPPKKSDGSPDWDKLNHDYLQALSEEKRQSAEGNLLRNISINGSYHPATDAEIGVKEALAPLEMAKHRQEWAKAQFPIDTSTQDRDPDSGRSQKARDAFRSYFGDEADKIPNFSGYSSQDIQDLLEKPGIQLARIAKMGSHSALASADPKKMAAALRGEYTPEELKVVTDRFPAGTTLEDLDAKSLDGVRDTLKGLHGENTKFGEGGLKDKADERNKTREVQIEKDKEGRKQELEAKKGNFTFGNDEYVLGPNKAPPGDAERTKVADALSATDTIKETTAKMRELYEGLAKGTIIDKIEAGAEAQTLAAILASTISVAQGQGAMSDPEAKRAQMILGSPGSWSSLTDMVGATKLGAKKLQLVDDYFDSIARNRLRSIGAVRASDAPPLDTSIPVQEPGQPKTKPASKPRLKASPHGAVVKETKSVREYADGFLELK